MFFLSIHLWLVNLTVGGAMLGLWFEWQRPSPIVHQVATRLARASWAALLGGGMVGVLHGWMIWDETWVARVGLLQSRVWYGVAELFFSLVLLIVYDLWFRRRPDLGRGWKWVRWLVLLGAVSNLWYHFPALFNVLQQLNPQDYAADTMLSSREYVAIMLTPSVLARWLHFTVACLAVAPIVTLLLIPQKETPGSQLDEGDTQRAKDQDLVRISQRMAGVSAAATWSQWLIGGAVLVSQPLAFQYRLMGEDARVCAGFAAALLLTVVLSAAQWRLLGSPQQRSLIWLVALLQGLVIVAMCWVVGQV